MNNCSNLDIKLSSNGAAMSVIYHSRDMVDQLQFRINVLLTDPNDFARSGGFSAVLLLQVPSTPLNRMNMVIEIQELS